MKIVLLIFIIQISFCLSLLAQEDSTTVNDTIGLYVTDDQADTLTTSIYSLEVEDIHPQDSPDDNKSELRIRGSVPSLLSNGEGLCRSRGK